MSVLTIDQVHDKLLTIDATREVLGQTEPLTEVAFSLAGDDVAFEVAPGWNSVLEARPGTDVLDASVRVQGSVYRLTKDAMLAATAAVGLPDGYVAKCPADLLSLNLAYWFSHDHRQMKMLARQDVAMGFTRTSLTPYSNLRLLDAALAAVAGRYGEGTVYADYKLAHSLPSTHLRLIVPETMRSVREGDAWSAGVQVANSLVGEEPTVLTGYMLRYWCTNGAIMTAVTSGNYSRRGGSPDEVYEWARRSVDEILGGLEEEFSQLDELTRIPVEGDVRQAAADLGLRIPRGFERDVVAEFRRTGDFTLYGLMNAITAFANGADVPERTRQALMTAGGSLPRAASQRCPHCGRAGH